MTTLILDKSVIGATQKRMSTNLQCKSDILQSGVLSDETMIEKLGVENCCVITLEVPRLTKLVVSI